MSDSRADTDVRLRLRRFYQTSEPYARHLERETEAYFARYLRLIEMYSRGAETILDAGCGTGLSSYMLSLRKRRVVGMDLSEFFLQRATPFQHNPNLHRIAGDMLELPFAKAAFDLVASYLVISFVPDVPRALSEMDRVLKPGGVVLIITPNQASPLWPLKDYLRQLRGGPGRPIFSETPLGALRTAVSNGLFSLQKVFETGPCFRYWEPDLSCRTVVGGESDSVYRSSPVDFSRYFQKKNYEVLRTGSESGWMEKFVPQWASSIEFVARKR